MHVHPPRARWDADDERDARPKRVRGVHKLVPGRHTAIDARIAGAHADVPAPIVLCVWLAPQHGGAAILMLERPWHRHTVTVTLSPHSDEVGMLLRLVPSLR